MLAAGRYELVLLSDNAREWVEHVEGIHGFLGMFSRRVYSFQTGRMKSSVETFRWLLGEIGREAGACLFVDDNAGNVANARAAGMMGVRFVGVEELKGEMERLGVV